MRWRAARAEGRGSRGRTTIEERGRRGREGETQEQKPGGEEGREETEKGRKPLMLRHAVGLGRRTVNPLVLPHAVQTGNPLMLQHAV